MRWFQLKRKPTKTDYLSSFRIAAPCKVDWDSMEGDDRVRLCGQCNKNVYNLSQMTDTEANEFLRLTNLKACVNFRMRSDGTIITDNCPVGLRKLRAQYRRAAAAITAIISFAQGLLLAGYAANSAQSGSNNPGATVQRGQPSAAGNSPNVPMSGGIAAPLDPPAAQSYRGKAKSRLVAAMPKNVECGGAALSLLINTDGSIKMVRLVAKSPSEEVDNLILESVRHLKFDKFPPDLYPDAMPGFALPMYFECRNAAAH